MLHENCRVRAIAHYLPQYHPIPENDEWWGTGFTEWTHVTRAKPLFRGHVQPRLPADLGFYDLRVPETRQAQADLAREHGIEAFCYWHYWFGGKRLLERPFQEVLETGQPDFPFCLAWANHPWTRAWRGKPREVLMAQTYPPGDNGEHFEALLPAFTDRRYVTIDGKPVFVVFKPTHLPEPQKLADEWRKLAEAYGLPGVFLLGIGCSPWSMSPWSPRDIGFDAALTTPGLPPEKIGQDNGSVSQPGKSLRRRIRELINRPVIRDYPAFVRRAYNPSPLPSDVYPAVLVNWDNTPRHGVGTGAVLVNNSPEAFGNHLRDAIRQVRDRAADHRLVFLKSWNEWAEGNYLEPDQQYGRSFLETVKRELVLNDEVEQPRPVITL